MTRDQIKALKRYAKKPISVQSDGLSEAERFLLHEKYITVSNYNIDSDPMCLFIFGSEFKITENGRAALAEQKKEKQETVIKIIGAFGAIGTIVFGIIALLL